MIPTPLSHLPQIAAVLGRDHEVIAAAGESEADLIEAVPAADALVATGMDVSKSVIEAGRRLLVIGTPQVGVDRIDIDAATAAGIPVISSQGLAATAVSEFTLGLMIMLSRRILAADRDLHGPDGWKSRRRYAEPDLLLAHEVRGTTVGVAGVGTIGSELARMASAALGCRILGFDPLVTSEAMRVRGIEKRETLEEIAREADFLVLHVPLTPETRHLVSADVLGCMKPTAFVINVSRGGVVDEAALGSALRAGTLAGAALDVYENEPLPSDSPLYELDNLILTPHIAGVTHEWNEQRSRAFAARLLEVFAGERPGGLANPDVWPQFERRRAALGS